MLRIQAMLNTLNDENEDLHNQVAMMERQVLPYYLCMLFVSKDYAAA